MLSGSQKFRSEEERGAAASPVEKSLMVIALVINSFQVKKSPNKFALKTVFGDHRLITYAINLRQVGS